MSGGKARAETPLVSWLADYVEPLIRDDYEFEEVVAEAGRVALQQGTPLDRRGKRLVGAAIRKRWVAAGRRLPPELEDWSSEWARTIQRAAWLAARATDKVPTLAGTAERLYQSESTLKRTLEDLELGWPPPPPPDFDRI